MKRARDVRDQLEGLMERVEVNLVSDISDSVAIRKVRILFSLPSYPIAIIIRILLVY